MEAWMLHVVWLLIGWWAGIFVALVVTGYARAVEVAERQMRLEEPGAVVERLDAGREWSVRVLH
jgi:hypothetical protein